MKKKVLTLLIAMFIILPCAFGFTACVNKNKTGAPAQIVGIEVIVKDNFDSPNYYSCVWDDIDGNKEACTLDDVKVYYKYSDGKRKEIESDKYSYMRIESDGAIYTPKLWSFFEDGESSRVNPGIYKMRFYSETKKYTADLAVEIFKIERTYLNFTINQYTNLDQTTYKTALPGKSGYHEINYMQDEFDKYPYFFEVNEGNELKDDNVEFLILNESEEYDLAEDKKSYIISNTIGKCVGIKFQHNDGSPLAPGNYLVIAKYGESIYYKSGYSKPIKIKILPRES